MAQHVGAISEITAKESIPASAMGITSYLKCKMQGGVPFKIVSAKKKGHFSSPACNHQRERGLRNGRYADHLFRRIVNKEQRLDPADSRHQGIYNVFSLLRTHGINITHVQVPVWDKDLDIRTTLDGLGHTKRGICVFELKTTTYSMREHLARYITRCSNRPTLSNGMVNTEKNIHALQVSFGIYCCKKLISSTLPVFGVVVVACTDGAKLYWSDTSLVTREAFDGKFTPSIPPTVHRRPYKRFLTLPSKGSVSYNDLKQALLQRGFSDLTPSNKLSLNCSGIASANTTRGSFKGVIGVLSAETCESTRIKHVSMLKSDANKVFIESKKKAHVTPFLVIPGGGGFKIMQVGKVVKAL